MPKEEKVRREKVLQKVVAKSVLAHNQKLVGTVQKVLIDEQKTSRHPELDSGSQATFFGRTEGYKVVEIKTDQPLEIGQFIDVKIESVSSWKLFGSYSTL